jgi:adenylate cyclase
MKRCPECRRDYYDDRLNFCLEDGAWLADALTMSDYPTEVMPGEFASGESRTKIFGAAFREAAEPRANSIAVLPFAHLSSDPDDEYFCDGLAEELINALAQIEDLKVVARTSAFSFKGKNVDVSHIGNVLNVNTILEGSVRKSGDQLRITVQLINAVDGYHLWSQKYDREMRDVFEVQDEITLAVVDALQSKLLGLERVELPRHREVDQEAYHHYLRGRFFVNKFNTENSYKALECFNQAILLEPDYAAAYAGVADAHVMLTEMGPVPPREGMPMAKENALKALAIDEHLAEAHSSLGMILQVYDYDFAEAEREFRRAIELSPNNPLPRQSYGILLTELERHDEANLQFQKALEVDPLSVVGNWIYSFCLFLARDYDGSLDRAHKTLELDPSFGVAYLSVAFALQMKDEYEASVEAYCTCSEVMGFPQNAEYIRESFAGGWEAFLRAMTSSDRPITFSSYIIAVFFATLGDKDDAFAELEASLAKRESHIVMMKSDPRFDSLRDDPRFATLLEKVGFPS